MSRYTRLTLEGQRVDIDTDGRCGVIDNGTWVLTLGTVRRDSAYASRWVACAEFMLPPVPSRSLGLRRFPTRRAGILALLNLTAWAPERAAQRTPLPEPAVVDQRLACRTSGEEREVDRLLRQYDVTVEALRRLGIDVVLLRSTDARSL